MNHLDDRVIIIIVQHTFTREIRSCKIAMKICIYMYYIGVDISYNRTNKIRGMEPWTLLR